jgi:hypothetical protein
MFARASGFPGKEIARDPGIDYRPISRRGSGAILWNEGHPQKSRGGEGHDARALRFGSRKLGFAALRPLENSRILRPRLVKPLVVASHHCSVDASCNSADEELRSLRWYSTAQQEMSRGR